MASWIVDPPRFTPTPIRATLTGITTADRTVSPWAPLHAPNRQRRARLSDEQSSVKQPHEVEVDVLKFFAKPLSEVATEKKSD
jgi:hypothetical protein